MNKSDFKLLTKVKFKMLLNTQQEIYLDAELTD